MRRPARTLDYAEPDGTKIDLMVSRLPSQKPAERRGVLLLNPGGPGGSGLTMPAELVKLGLPLSVSSSYDLIGMDTRGVGHSSPVSCGFTNTEEWYGNIPPYAVDRAAVAEQAVKAKNVAERCAANDKDGQMRHVSTANMARDLDRIRAALGEKKASFLGLSYGSALGAAYASMFPGTTDRVMIDSNLGDTHLSRAGIRRFGQGAEQTFPDFAKWLAKRHAAYRLGRTPAQVRRTYFKLAAQLDEKPVDGIDGALFRLATFAGLYNEVSYPRTAQAWQSVRTSDGAGIRELAKKGPPGVPEGDASAAAPKGELAPFDNAWSVFLAVTCNDVEWPSSVREYQRSVAVDRTKYPLYGAASANVVPCAFWSLGPSEPPVQIEKDGPANVLVMQNLRDPVTPYRGGVLARNKFGDRSRLVTVDGSGHGVYVYGKNACALNVGTAYLVDGKFPKKDVFCPSA